MASSLGKRQRERQKLEKAQAKAERKAARQAAQVEQVDVSSQRSESELMEDLGNLQQAFEAGQISAEDFADRREQIQAQFEQLLR
jgi:hypothetical protein